MSEPNEPRTFWLAKPDLDFDLNWKQIHAAEFPHKNTKVDCLHVIEHSAYLAVCKERDELREAYDQLLADYNRAAPKGPPSTLHQLELERDELKKELEASGDFIWSNEDIEKYCGPVYKERDRLKADLDKANERLKIWDSFGIHDDRDRLRAALKVASKFVYEWTPANVEAVKLVRKALEAP